MIYEILRESVVGCFCIGKKKIRVWFPKLGKMVRCLLLVLLGSWILDNATIKIEHHIFDRALQKISINLYRKFFTTHI